MATGKDFYRFELDCSDLIAARVAGFLKFCATKYPEASPFIFNRSGMIRVYFNPYSQNKKAFNVLVGSVYYCPVDSVVYAKTIYCKTVNIGDIIDRGLGFSGSKTMNSICLFMELLNEEKTNWN